MTAQTVASCVPEPRGTLPAGSLNLYEQAKAGQMFRVRTDVRLYTIIKIELCVLDRDKNTDSYLLTGVSVTSPDRTWRAPDWPESTTIDCCLVPGEVLHICGKPAGRIQSIRPVTPLHAA